MIWDTVAPNMEPVPIQVISPEQTYSNAQLNLILLEGSTILSILGCLLIIGSYIMYKDIRTPSRHIIVCISIADLVVAVTNLFVAFANVPVAKSISSDICVLRSYIGSIATLWSFMWTMALSIFLNILIVQKSPQFAESLIHKVFHIVCWLLPIVINLFGLGFHKLGNSYDLVASGWCWIELKLNETSGIVENRGDAIFWMTLDYKGIEIITYLVIAVMYLRIKLHLRNKIKNYENSERKLSSFVSPKSIQAAKTTDRKLVFIPVMLILLRIWGTVRYILFIYRKDMNIIKHNMSMADKVLLSFQTVGDNLIGAVNCVLFCFLTPKVWNHLKESCSSIKSFFRKKGGKNISTDQEEEPDEKSRLISQAM